MKLSAKLFGVLALATMGSGCGPSTPQNSSVYRYGTTDPSELPANYESKLACEKQDLLWKNIQNSKYSSLPPWGGFNIFKFSFTDMSLTMDRVSDELPVGRERLIHTFGTVAKVKFVATPGNPFSGLYQGSECGLLRLSLAANPAQTNVTPGFGYKALVDAQPSQNIIAMYSLDGQGKNANFFANEFSNMIAEPSNPALKILKKIFDRASKHALHLDLEHFAKLSEKGQKVEAPSAPFQLFFVPTQQAQLPSNSVRDAREDIATLPSGTTLYEVQASLKEGGPRQNIGSLVTTSEFVASKYGDEKLFFRHRRFRNE